MILEAIDIGKTLAGLTPLRGRGAHTTEAEVDAAFATLSAFRDGGVFVGSFEGDSGWEIHTAGDEIVYVLGGATTLTIITDDGPHAVEMTAGTLIVVPQGCWHRFNAAEQVTVLTATPQPTEHSFADDPRTADDA